MKPDKFSGGRNFQHGWKDFVETEYSDIVYGNVCSAVRLFFPPGEDVLDLACGPGLCALRLLQEEVVKPGSLILFDYNESYIEVARRKLCGAIIMQGDLFLNALPHAPNCIFINATGYFTLKQIRDILDRLSAKRVIVNFFFAADQIHKSSRLIRRVRNRFSFRLWGGDVLKLEGLSVKPLYNMLRDSGWKVEGEFRYFDFKFERLLLLSR